MQKHRKPKGDLTITAKRQKTRASQSPLSQPVAAAWARVLLEISKKVPAADKS